MPAASQPDSSFRAAAQRVVARWVLARWCRLLGRSALPLCAAAAALVVGMWLLRGGLSAFSLWKKVPVPLFVAALVPLWLAVTAAWAWLRRPSLPQAMALWDELAGRDEMLVSAYCFEEAAEREDSVGERLHLAVARERLPGELAALPKHLPIRVPHRAWLAPLALVLLIAGAALHAPRHAGDGALSDAARERARREADTLAATQKVLDPLKGLSPEERKAIDELKKALDQTAGRLKELGKETPRDVLGELERRARAAEQLAESLGAAGEELLSQAMIAELERHTDTADFASQVRAKALQKLADEAGKLADRLRTDGLPLEEQKRIEEAVDGANKQATEVDKKRVIGEGLAKAGQELAKNQPRPAGEEFSKVAKHFTQAAQRQAGQRQLQQLAQNLRASGQRIFGGKQAGVQRLAQAPPAGLRPLDGRPQMGKG